MRPSAPFTDIHCHMLPGMDDGARDEQEALAMADMAVRDGVETVVVTPHQLGQYACNRGETIRTRTSELQRALDEHHIPLRLLPGADVRIDDSIVTALRDGHVVSVADHRRHVLLELPHELYLPLEPLIAQLRSAGLTAILSHPERNRGILARPELLPPLVDAGCLMQVTAGSLTGQFGRTVQALGEKLVAEGLIHFVASDAHSTRGRTPVLRPAFDRVAARTDDQTATDLCCRYPALVADGQPVPAGRRRKRTRAASWFRWSRRRFLTAGTMLAAGAFGALGANSRAAKLPSNAPPPVGPFRCHTDVAIDHYGRLLTELNQLQVELVRVLNVRPAATPIDLYLFGDQASYRRFIRQRLPGVPYRRALFVKNDTHSEVFAYRSSQMAIDLRHECTHALLHAVLEMIPLWLDEGLAEYFEVSADQRAFDNPHLARLKWDMRLGIIVTLEDLERKRQTEEMGVLEYRFSWAWVHFMLHGPARAHQELVAFLADIQTGTPPGRLSARLAASMPNVERQMVDHFKHWRRGRD